MTPKQRLTQALTVRVAPLSFGRLVAVVSGLLTLAAFAGGAMRAVDHRYVRTDTFRIFQQGERETRITDSLNHEGEVKDIRRMLSGLDSTDRCRRGQSGFCR